MKNPSSSEIFNDPDEYPEVTQADLDRSRFRVRLKNSLRKQSILTNSDRKYNLSLTRLTKTTD